MCSRTGDAQFYGSEGATALNAPVVGMAATPDGRGYWLVGSDGGVFAFGDAAFRGSEGGTALNAPVTGMAATNDGGGYWLAAGDGGVFAFGDAAFDGSASGLVTHPVLGVAADGGGYWLATSDFGPTPPPLPQILADCTSPAARPAVIILACADHGSILEGITWSSWTATGAFGNATYRFNTCTPDCAAGTFVSAPATVQVSAPVMTFAGVEFTNATWTFADPTAAGATTTLTSGLSID